MNAFSKLNSAYLSWKSQHNFLSYFTGTPFIISLIISILTAIDVFAQGNYSFTFFNLITLIIATIVTASIFSIIIHLVLKLIKLIKVLYKKVVYDAADHPNSETSVNDINSISYDTPLSKSTDEAVTEKYTNIEVLDYTISSFNINENCQNNLLENYSDSDVVHLATLPQDEILLLTDNTQYTPYITDNIALLDVNDEISDNAVSEVITPEPIEASPKIHSAHKKSRFDSGNDFDVTRFAGECNHYIIAKEREERYNKFIANNTSSSHVVIPPSDSVPDEESTPDSNNDFDSMDGKEFENFCAKLLTYNGYENVRVTTYSKDQGIDIIAYKDNVKYGIQCKCYSSNIGNKAVQEAYAGKTFYQCHLGAVLTNRYFTPNAKELAAKSGVLLWDRTILKKWIKNIPS